MSFISFVVVFAMLAMAAPVGNVQRGQAGAPEDAKREFTVSGCLVRSGYAGYQVEDARIEAIDGKSLSDSSASAVPRPASPKKWAIEKPQIDPPQEITATGCLAKDAGRFLLKDVAIEITPWVAPTVRNTSSGSSKPSASKTVFALQNPQGLEAHVGHHIQVRGVVAPATANLPPSPDTIAPARGFNGVPQPTFPGPAAVTRIAHPGLDNKDLLMIAPSCAQANKPTGQSAK